MFHAQIPDVDTYIANTVLQSYLWDNMTLQQKNKVVGQSEWTLRNVLDDYYGDILVPIPTDILAIQVMWVARIDDTILRAEVGMRNVWVDGTMITLDRIDTTIAPMIYRVLGIAVGKNGKRRRVTGYVTHVDDTSRMGHREGIREDSDVDA